MEAAELLDGLAKEDPDAIRQLAKRIAPLIGSLAKQFGLYAEDAQELQCDCILVFIRKIREGAYVWNGQDPAAYAAVIARNLARNYGRKVNRHPVQTLDEVEGIADLDPGYAGKEAVERLDALLDRIEARCRELIRWKYLDGWSDKDLIERGMTPYRSIPALKNKRSHCMKALTALAAQGFTPNPE